MEPQDALCDGMRVAIVAALQEGGPALVAAATTELRARVQAFLEEDQEQQQHDHEHEHAASNSKPTTAAMVVRALARALGRGVGELREVYATARAERGGVDPTTGLAPGLALVRGLQCQALLRLQLGALVHGGDPLPEKVMERARRYLADLQLRQTTTTLEGKASGGGGGGGAASLDGAQWEAVGGEDGDDDDEGLLLSQDSAKRGPAAEMDACFEAFLAKGVLAAFGRTHPKACLALYAALECDPPAELLALAGPDATTTDAAAAAAAAHDGKQQQEGEGAGARRGPVFHLRAQEREQAQAMGFVSAYAEREAQRKQRGDQGVVEGKDKGEPVVEPAAPPQPQQQQPAKQQKRVLGRSASLPVTLGGGSGGGSLLAQAAAAGGKRGGGSHYQVHVKAFRNPNMLAQSRRPAPLARTASVAASNAGAAMPLQPLPGALNRSVSSVAALSSSAASLTLAAAAGPPSAAAAGIIKKRSPVTASGADPGQRLLAKRMRPAAATTITAAAAAASMACASEAAEPFPPGSPRASAGMGGFASPLGNKGRRSALAASDTVLGTPPPSTNKHKGGGADEALVIAGTPDQPPVRRRVGGGVFGLGGTGRIR